MGVVEEWDGLCGMGDVEGRVREVPAGRGG